MIYSVARSRRSGHRRTEPLRHRASLVAGLPRSWGRAGQPPDLAAGQQQGPVEDQQQHLAEAALGNWGRLALAGR
jgi:hypothetical protein